MCTQSVHICRELAGTLQTGPRSVPGPVHVGRELAPTRETRPRRVRACQLGAHVYRRPAPPLPQNAEGRARDGGAALGHAYGRPAPPKGGGNTGNREVKHHASRRSQPGRATRGPRGAPSAGARCPSRTARWCGRTRSTRPSRCSPGPCAARPRGPRSPSGPGPSWRSSRRSPGTS